MKHRDVYCERCADVIKSNGELVTTFTGLWISAYHDECFSSELKSARGLFISKQPINSTSTNVICVVFAVIVLIACVFTHLWWPLLLALIAPGIRFMSWFLFERYLP